MSPTRGTSNEHVRHTESLRILCELAELDPRELSLQPWRYVPIAYPGDDELRREVRWLVDGIREDHVALLLELTERDWLAEGEWEAFDLQVELEVRDYRTFPERALPEITLGR